MQMTILRDYSQGPGGRAQASKAFTHLPEDPHQVDPWESRVRRDYLLTSIGMHVPSHI